MQRSVLVAGAGQLGCRYIQGLLLSKKVTELWIYDNDPSAQTRVERDWTRNWPYSVNFTSRLTDLPQKIGLAIVAVTANCRLDVVEQILSSVEVEAWILEKVLCQSIAELDRLDVLLGASKSAWVNTPRMMWNLYKKLNALYPSPKIITATVSGFQGLACNSIHYIDLIGRWSASEPVTIDSSALQPTWIESKRSGFYEVEGILEIKFSNGSRLILQTSPRGEGHAIKLKIDTDIWIVSEIDGYAESRAGTKIEGKAEYQSQMTAPLVEAIFEQRDIKLPFLSESIQQHRPLIRELLMHWREHMDRSTERLPVT